MKFRTTYNEGFRAPHVGSRYTRTWIFERRCGPRSCRLRVRRETSTGGFITLRLRRSGSVYTAHWRTRASCRSGGSFPYSETITFAVSRSVSVGDRRYASRVTGRLVGRSPAHGCQRRPGEARDRISGRRTDVPSPPEADFSYVPSWLSVTAGSSTVYLSDESLDEDGEIVAWQWEFGDPASGAENTASDERPSHVYRTPGLYRVLLTVTDDDGLHDTAERLLTVSP
jgi:PKD repeat protein